ncbi:MAG: SdrD B-like domain-containing protein [Paracoccaceae bacterium]
MTTYTFTAYEEQDLLQDGDSNLNVGDTIEVPGGASVTFTVQDDDSTLSGDNYVNENASDSTGQTASITEPGGGEVGNGGQIYAESYYWVYDSNGTWFLMLEIEQEGTGEQYYTFHEAYGTPPSGTTLTVHSVCNVSSEWVDYNCLDAGEVSAPGSIAGRYFYDSDGDNTEWNADTNSWEEGVSGKLVFLFDANWNEVARTTTDQWGNYSFDGLEPGTHHVMFEGTEGADFVQADVGDHGADSDVTWTDQNGTGGVWGVQVHPGQTVSNVDAGIRNTLTDGNEASTVDEDAGVVALTNVLLNTVDPEAGDPVVYAVWGENGPMTGNVGQPIAGSNGGIFVINADGSITFDTNGAFDSLANGETTTTDIWYCVKDAAGKIVESKYTVTIIGEDEPIVVTAADDFITVFETETAGDLEILEDGSDSVLDNDTQNGVDYTGNVVEVNGVAGQVGQFIDLDGGGRVMINADGTVDFDANGDFDALNDGDSDVVTVDYTIRTQEQADKPQNVLIVIDVSNSTVSLESGTQNVFDGADVGDVNGDGRADTVLDAQIVAAQALIDDLRSQGLDPSLVNIGIATFSGVDTTGGSAYNDATVDSEIVGTFNLNDAGIDSALAGILSGSWTNYEAGLSEAESWFGANAQAGDGNTMYFLSDGRPITSYENGAYVEQDTAAFLDELGQIEANYGANIHAVGVGANSSLEVLDQIDNTGGAVQVTDAASLTAALLNTADIDTEQASATVTIKVLGEDEPVVALAAVDDFIKVAEAETFGDTEAILDSFTDDSAATNILANDNPGGDLPTEVATVIVNGVEGNFGEFIDILVNGENRGRVKIFENGEVDFDANGDFDALEDDQSETVTFDYTIARGSPSTTQSRMIDFEGFNAGDVVSGVEGVTISAVRDGQTSSVNQAMIFDTSSPTGGDTDLATSNLGNVLIVTEDGDSSDPDDNWSGGTFVFEFDTPSTVDSITFLDTEEPVPTVRFFDADGGLISEQDGPVTNDGGQETRSFDVDNVARMEVELQGSGAIDNIAFTETVAGNQEVAEATVTVLVEGSTDDNPTPDDPVYTLRGDVTTDDAETQTLTFVLDHSFDMYRRLPSLQVEDTNGDGSNQVIDAVLGQIADQIASAGLDPQQKVHFVLAGENAPVSQLTLTAGAVVAAIAAGNLPAQFNQALAQAPGSEVAEGTDKAVNFAQALEAAKDYITSNGTPSGPNEFGPPNSGFGENGADDDQIVVITATDGTDSFFQYDGLESGDTTEQDLYLNLAATLEDDNGIDADIQVIAVNTGINLATIGADYYDIAFNPDGSVNTTIIDPSNTFDPLLLVDLDSDGIITNATDAESFGLESLVAPATVTAGEVISIQLGGETIEVDDDLNVPGFEFEFVDLIENPADIGVIVNVDSTGDGVADQSFDVTSTLIETDLGNDSFLFEFDLNVPEQLLV